MDISRLKKQLEEVFDEGYRHPSDVDIFAQPEQYEYDYENCEFVDIDAMHAEMVKEHLLSNPELYEDKEEYEVVKDFIDSYKTKSPAIGQKYVYMKLLVIPPMKQIGVSYFSENFTLHDIDDQNAYFKIRNSIKKFPKTGLIKEDSFSQVYFFESVKQAEKLIMTIKMKFTDYRFSVHSLGADVLENKNASVRLDPDSVGPDKNKKVHKSDTPAKIKANLKKLAKQFNVEVVDDFEDYTSNAKKKTDGETSLMTKSIREEHEYSSTLLDKYWRIFTEIATQSYPDTDPVEAMSARYLSFDMDKLQAAANKYGYNHPMDFFDELDNSNNLTEAPGDIRKGLGALAVVAALYGVLEVTSAKHTPLGKAMQEAAQSGDPVAKKHLPMLDTYVEANSSILDKLSAKYLQSDN